MASELKWRHITGSFEGSVWVIATEAEIEEYRSGAPSQCKHPKSELRDYPTSNGVWQRKDQCLTCGLPTSKAHKREKGVEVPQWDFKLTKNWEVECDYYQSLVLERLVSRTEEFESSGYELYEDYLKSEDWKSRRNLVLKRDGGICQGCLSANASDVHHLTYDNIFQEFLFQLISVCRNCHERLHKKKIIALEASRAKGLDGGK
jgi:hypothetical protein